MAAIFVDRFFCCCSCGGWKLKTSFQWTVNEKVWDFFSCRGKLRPLRKELIGLNRWGEIFSNKWTFASTFLTPTLSRRNLISWKGKSWSLQLFKEIFFSLNSAYLSRIAGRAALAIFSSVFEFANIWAKLRTAGNKNIGNQGGIFPLNHCLYNPDNRQSR